MLKNLLIPSAQNAYKPFFSSKSALVIFTLWLLVFNSVSSVLISSHGVYANTLSSDRVVQLTNQERIQRDLKPLRVNALLTSAAYTKANNMFQEQYWDHFGPNGETPWQFIRASGYEYTYAGENLGKGFTTSEGLHQAWMASVTHRDNIANKEYTDIGVAIVNGTLLNQNITLVVQLFGSPVDESLVLGDAIVEQGESLNGELKSIRIIYPEDGVTYNTPHIPVKGDVDSDYKESSIQIISENDVLGVTRVYEENFWMFEKPYDWKQGKNTLDAMILGEQEHLIDSVSFYVDSVAPSLENIKVEKRGDLYEVNMEIDKVPASVSIISGENIYQADADTKKVQLSIDRDDVRQKVFLILSDQSGNINEMEITKYFPYENSENNLRLGVFFTAPDAQRVITILFALFILGILLVQFYYYKKLGMLKQREGDFLMLGLWWLILLFGSFIGYAGTVT